MKKNSPKKIILIIVDTLRADKIGLYGQRPSFTPNIDRLGQNGVIFDNAYTTITKTDPAITSIMSGRYPIALGLVNHGKYVSKEEQKAVSQTLFIPEILRSYRYKTAAIDWLSRWHTRGYDYYSGKIIKDIDSSRLLRDRLPPILYLRMLDKITIKLFKRELFVSFFYTFFKNVKAPYDSADVVVDRAINTLNMYKDQKLFLYIHLWDPHLPHTRFEGIRDYFSTVDRAYQAEVAFVDQELGRFIDYLNLMREFDDSLIIITSDHGENFYEYGVPFNHECLYEDVVRVPLILRHRSFSPKKVNAFVQHVDILPTILALIKAKIPQDVDGKSLLPLIQGKEKNVRDFVYFEDIVRRRLQIFSDVRRRGIRIGEFKYIETFKGRKEDLSSVIPSGGTNVVYQELYNIKRDPKEKNNLILAKQKKAYELQARLERCIDILANKRFS